MVGRDWESSRFEVLLGQLSAIATALLEGCHDAVQACGHSDLRLCSGGGK